MKIETVDIDSIFPDPKNANTHPTRNLRKIANSLKEFGQERPIVVGPRNIIVVGNGTHAAARMIGLRKVFVTRTKLRGHKLAAYAVADNETGKSSKYDNRQLADTLQVLRAEDVTAFAATGYDTTDVDALLASLKPADEKPVQSKARSEHRCPECGHCWTGSSHPPKNA